MHKLISIVGPTATGKTNLALTVAEKIGLSNFTGVDIISADSRQVYKGLEIISGADIPEGFELDATGSFFEKDKVCLFGLSMLDPDKEWSVGQFQEWAQKIIEESWQNSRLPIVVGGTGLYHKQLWQEDQRLQVPPNVEVRERAENLSLEELQNWLKELDEQTFELMNHSDQLNPRRLVRKIELLIAEENEEVSVASKDQLDFHHIVVGLTDELETLEHKIGLRVEERFKAGAIQELEKIVVSFPDQKLPIFSSTGVKPLLGYMSEQIDKETCLEMWWRQERQYAKRQLTWWKKQEGVKWFAVSSSHTEEEVLHYLHYVGISQPQTQS